MSRYYRIRERFVPGTIVSGIDQSLHLIISIRWVNKNAAFLTWFSSNNQVTNTDIRYTLGDFEYYLKNYDVYTSS